jgi:hypothetical protein
MKGKKSKGRRDRIEMKIEGREKTKEEEKRVGRKRKKRGEVKKYTS